MQGTDQAGARPDRALEAVVFDMGGVLMNFDGMLFARHYTECEQDAELLFGALFGSGQWPLLDAGVIGHDTIRRYAEDHLPERLHDALHACIEGWPALSDPFPETNDLARRLKERGLKVFLLSNASTRIGEQLDHMPAWPLMDGAVVSGFERLMKPDVRIYGLLCERYCLDPAGCLFVDDNLDNCRGAEAVGMSSWHFTGDAAALEAEISRRLGQTA